MPYYRSSYNRYSRRWPYRSWRRSGVTRAQQSGRRYFNVSFPVENVISLTVAANQPFTNVVRTSPWRVPTGTADTDANRAAYAVGLVASIAYRRYSQLYDQVKINSVSITVSVAATIGEGGIPGLRAYTCWDRDYQASEALLTSSQLLEGPESQAVTFINNSRAKFTRYNRASDLQERTTFCDSTYHITSNDSIALDQWAAANNRSVGYTPSMALVFQTSNVMDATRTITIQMQARYNVTFRNPKFGLSVDGVSRGIDDEVMEKSVAAVKQEEKKDDGMEEEKPVVKRKKVVMETPVYEEEVLPDDDDTLIEMDDEEEEQEPLTQKKTVLKKAGKKSSS